MRNIKFLGLIWFAAFMLIGFFQNCSKVNFTSAIVPQINPLKASNGGIYGGEQSFVFHHYQKGFTCEGRPQPESILLSKDKISWVFIQNTKEKCASEDEIAVTGVDYDSTAIEAKYNQNIYVPPAPYLVDASEDPNLPDVKLEDGVCEDINGKCSLLAAVQEAGYASKTAASGVLIPPSPTNYLMTGPINFTSLDNPITISGYPNATIDGQQITNLFRFQNSNGKITFENLKLQNAGYAGSTQFGSAIYGSYFNAVDILNCQFISSVSQNALDLEYEYSTTSSVLVQNSNFTNNSGALSFFGVYSAIIEDSHFTGSSSQSGPYISTGTNNIFRRSSVDGLNTGLSVAMSTNTLIENSTFYNNSFGANFFFPNMGGLTYSVTFRNSTLYNNNTLSASAGLYFMNNIPGQSVNIENSIVAQANASHPDCSNMSIPVIINATNSIFDDSSCAQGSSNFTTDPMLGSYQNNGGPTPTLLPLSGSPAIDSGSNLICATTDQRNLPRPVGATCDIGAIEVQ